MLLWRDLLDLNDQLESRAPDVIKGRSLDFVYAIDIASFCVGLEECLDIAVFWIH